MKDKLIEELEILDIKVCSYMKQWDGVDISKIPKEFHGYRYILSELDSIITELKLNKQVDK